ncbi:hypothetical protein [Rosistilla oblonga]|uniref:hypothetical protein n=1 Tax=Rosistilla oblonga TaxID=2527990 RepID=UPI003A9737CD
MQPEHVDVQGVVVAAAHDDAGTKRELIFNDWKWTARELNSGLGREIERQLTATEALSYFHEWLFDGKQKPVQITFLERFPVPFLLYTQTKDGKTTAQFNPRGWKLVGIGFKEFDYCPMGEWFLWSESQFLFGRENAWVLICEAQHIEAPMASDPTAKVLSCKQAADWCVTNGVEVPPELSGASSIPALTPEMIQEDASSVSLLACERDSSEGIETSPIVPDPGDSPPDVAPSSDSLKTSVFNVRKGLIHVAESIDHAKTLTAINDRMDAFKYVAEAMEKLQNASIGLQNVEETGEPGCNNDLENSIYNCSEPLQTLSKADSQFLSEVRAFVIGLATETDHNGAAWFGAKQNDGVPEQLRQLADEIATRFFSLVTSRTANFEESIVYSAKFEFPIESLIGDAGTTNVRSKPPLPNVRLTKTQDRILRAIWDSADWTRQPPRALIDPVVMAVWDDPEKRSTALRSQLTKLNNTCLEDAVGVSLSVSGDWIVVEYSDSE